MHQFHYLKNNDNWYREKVLSDSQISPANYIVPFVKGRQILGKNMPT